MGSPVELYQQEMHEQIGFFASWLPADPVEVGWIGTFERGQFRRQSSLDALGIEFDIDESDSPQDVQCESTSGVSINQTAGAGVAKLASASFTIEFTRSGAFVFHALRLRRRSIDNMADVADQLLELHDAKRWDQRWRLVDGHHLADSATILVANGSSASIELKAQVDGELLAISLADPRVGLEIVKTRGNVFKAVASQGLQPLYSCVYVKDPLFRSSSVQPVRGARGGSETTFARPSIRELLES